MEGIVFLLSPARGIPHFGFPRQITARRVRGHTTHELRDTFNEVIGSSVNPGDDLVVAIASVNLGLRKVLEFAIVDHCQVEFAAQPRKNLLRAQSARERAAWRLFTYRRAHRPHGTRPVLTSNEVENLFCEHGADALIPP